MIIENYNPWDDNTTALVEPGPERGKNDQTRVPQLLWLVGHTEFTWTQVGPPAWRWALHETQTDKTDADKNAKTQRENINCVYLAFIKLCQGREKKSVFCFHTAPRDVFVNVTLVKLFATVSPVDATSSLEQRKPAGANDKITRWYLFYSFNW